MEENKVEVEQPAQQPNKPVEQQSTVKSEGIEAKRIEITHGNADPIKITLLNNIAGKMDELIRLLKNITEK